MIQKQADTLSPYVPYISFGRETYNIVNKEFIEPKVKAFFDFREIKRCQPIEPKKYIADLDFKTVEIAYFYENILKDIKKDNGGIHHIVKYCITFDEEVTSEICGETNIKYDEILLYKKPIFYFIYIDLKEIMKFLREKYQK